MSSSLIRDTNKNMKKYCIHCKKYIKVKKPCGIAFHRTNCKYNSDYTSCKKRQSLAQTLPRTLYILKCNQCNKEYSLILTKKQFELKKYKKHCSRHCANKRIQTELTKLKISNKLKHKRKIVLCKFCKKKITLRKNDTQIFCSYQCSSKFNATNINWRKKISNSTKGKCGGYRIGSGIGKRGWYFSSIAGKVFLDSSYELEYAKYLDRNKINWIKNKKKFLYFWKNEKHNYIPDFYLSDTNEYKEIKGYIRQQDLAKWKYFPYKLQILMKKDLIKLGIIIK